jgi:hypothetical protein
MIKKTIFIILLFFTFYFLQAEIIVKKIGFGISSKEVDVNIQNLKFNLLEDKNITSIIGKNWVDERGLKEISINLVNEINVLRSIYRMPEFFIVENLIYSDILNDYLFLDMIGLRENPTTEPPHLIFGIDRKELSVTRFRRLPMEAPKSLLALGIREKDLKQINKIFKRYSQFRDKKFLIEIIDLFLKTSLDVNIEIVKKDFKKTNKKTWKIVVEVKEFYKGEYNPLFFIINKDKLKFLTDSK